MVTKGMCENTELEEAHAIKLSPNFCTITAPSRSITSNVGKCSRITSPACIDFNLRITAIVYGGPFKPCAYLTASVRLLSHGLSSEPQPHRTWMMYFTHSHYLSPIALVIHIGFVCFSPFLPSVSAAYKKTTVVFSSTSNNKKVLFLFYNLFVPLVFPLSIGALLCFFFLPPPPHPPHPPHSLGPVGYFLEMTPFPILCT